MAISPQQLTIYLYSAHRAVIFAIAQLSCYIFVSSDLDLWLFVVFDLKSNLLPSWTALCFPWLPVIIARKSEERAGRMDRQRDERADRMQHLMRPPRGPYNKLHNIYSSLPISIKHSKTQLSRREQKLYNRLRIVHRGQHYRTLMPLNRRRSPNRPMYTL